MDKIERKQKISFKGDYDITVARAALPELQLEFQLPLGVKYSFDTIPKEWAD